MSTTPAARKGLDLAKIRQPGSPLLTAWKADRERARREQAAEREMRAALSQFRKISGGATPARRATLDVLPQPAFAQVSGQRAFAAAVSDRLTAGWVAFCSGINADLEGALPSLVARSRDWCVNTDMGRRYITLVQDNIVGHDVPRLQVRATMSDGSTLDEVANTAIEQAWWQFCQVGNCEVTGQLSMAGVCRTVAAAAARDGEYLARRIRGRGVGLHGLLLQLLDVDRINTTANSTGGPGRNAIRLGVEIDALGRKQAMHLHASHPGDSGAGLAPRGMTDRVEMANLLHGFVLERPEQVRGFPWTAPVLLSANQLAAYKNYALVAAKIGAAKMGFYVTDKEAPAGEAPTFEDYKDATGQLVQDVEAGMLEALPPGVTFESFNPAYPHEAFGEFVLGHERGMSAGLNVAHHNLSGNMSGVNYSSARIAELSERSHWRALQWWFIDTFLRPVFADWLQMALLGGHIRLPSGVALPADRFDKFFSAATFQPRGWGWVDPKNDAETAEIRLRNGLGSLRQFNDETGVDEDDVIADMVRIKGKYEAAGLPLPSWLQPKAAPANPQGNAA